VKINKPTVDIPRHSNHVIRGKYAEAYRAADKLKANQWLPVEFATAHEAYNFRVAVATHRKKLMDAILRGCMVYIRKKPTTSTRKEGGR